MTFYKANPSEIEEHTKKLDDLLTSKTPTYESEKKIEIQGSVKMVNYSGKLNLEEICPRKDIGKRLFTHWDSYQRIKKENLTDHMPIETQMSIFLHLMDLGNKSNLPQEFSKLWNDMVKKPTEWSSTLMETKGNFLIIYNNNNGMNWNSKNNSYTQDVTYSNMGHSYLRKNHLLKKIWFRTKVVETSIPSDRIVSLGDVNEINPSIVRRLFSLPFNQLPEEVRSRGTLSIPHEGKILPVARGLLDNNYHVFTSQDVLASRGYKLK